MKTRARRGGRGRALPAACALGALLSLEQAACAGPRPAGDKTQQARSKMQERLEKHFKQAEVVALARPLGLEPSPKVWSGVLATFQGVRYQVIRYYKGSGPDTITVMHPLVARSATADPKEPRLSATLFNPQATLLVFARRQDGQLQCLDENDGVVPATDEALAQVRRLSGKAE